MSNVLNNKGSNEKKQQPHEQKEPTREANNARKGSLVYEIFSLSAVHIVSPTSTERKLKLHDLIHMLRWKEDDPRKRRRDGRERAKLLFQDLKKAIPKDKEEGDGDIELDYAKPFFKILQEDNHIEMRYGKALDNELLHFFVLDYFRKEGIQNIRDYLMHCACANSCEDYIYDFPIYAVMVDVVEYFRGSEGDEYIADLETVWKGAKEGFEIAKKDKEAMERAQEEMEKYECDGTKVKNKGTGNDRTT